MPHDVGSAPAAARGIRPVRSDVAAVVIGRNEGARLQACLQSLTGTVGSVIYVDSGSTDGSAAMARALGATVIQLDLSQPFTAARARNAGLAVPASRPNPPVYVQFVDGDCELRAGWLASAADYLDRHADVAVVCGRRRERHPAASVYNRLCDAEWDTPIGEAKACGGDALMRTQAVVAVGGFREGLIAGEEPELCIRLRRAGWRIRRLDVEMTWHDAAMSRFGQWWRRARRAGYAFAEGAALHGSPPERHWVRETRRALLWGFGVPAATLAAASVTPLSLLVPLVYPAQVLRLAVRDEPRSMEAWERAFFAVLGKAPEAVGVAEFLLRRLMNRRGELIEYK